MVAGNKFYQFTEDQARGVHDWDLHTFKVLLTLTAPVLTNAVRADLTEIAAGDGYTTGGAATTITVSETTGVTTLQGTEITWTATAGTFAPFRYAVLYNDTPTSPADPVIFFWDYGSTVQLGASEVLVFRPNNTSPGTLFTLT